MNFNKEKNVLHSNAHESHSLLNRTKNTIHISAEHDFDVITDFNLDFDTHINNITSKVNRILGLKNLLTVEMIVPL